MTVTLSIALWLAYFGLWAEDGRDPQTPLLQFPSSARLRSRRLPVCASCATPVIRRRSSNGCIQSVPVLLPATPNGIFGRKQLFRVTGARRVYPAKPGCQVQPADLITGHRPVEYANDQRSTGPALPVAALTVPPCPAPAAPRNASALTARPRGPWPARRPGQAAEPTIPTAA